MRKTFEVKAHTAKQAREGVYLSERDKLIRPKLDDFEAMRKDSRYRDGRRTRAMSFHGPTIKMEL